MKRLLFGAAALAVLLAACKDDDTNPAPAPQATKLYLNEVSESDSISATYNTDKRIDKLNRSSLDLSYKSHFLQFEYKDGKVMKVSSGADSTTALQAIESIDYNEEGNLLKVKFYDKAGKAYVFDSLAYDMNGRLEAIYVGEIGERNIYQKFACVWDNKGNIIKEYQIGIKDGKEDTDTITTTYTFDDKVNYLAKQPEMYLLDAESPSLGFSTNNILTKKYGFDTDYTLETNEYTYDEENYPVTKKNTFKVVNDGVESLIGVTNTKIRYIKK